MASRSPDQNTQTIRQMAGLALQRLQAGRFPEAEVTYRKILDADPEHSEALHFLGVIALQTGRAEEAAHLIERAIHLTPEDANALNNLGQAYESLERWDDAAGVYRRVLQCVPDHDAALNNLGNILAGKGEFAQAIQCYQRALEVNKTDPDIFSNLGDALLEQGLPGDAVAPYREALRLHPGFFEVHVSLGTALREQGLLDEAIASYRTALTLRPESAETHTSLGNALHTKGLLDAAVASHRTALGLKPDYANAYNNLGNALKDQGLLDEAVEHYRRGLAIKPDFVVMHYNLGATLHNLGKLEDAIGHYQKALEIRPDYARAGKSLLFTLLNLPGCSPQQLFTEHLRIAENQTQGITRLTSPFANDANPNRRLRVGYLSSDFWAHSVGMNVLPLLSCHDKTQFEVFCYADVPAPDSITGRFRATANHWRAITGKSDAAVAQAIRTDEIDILVCLAGHFDGNRPLVCAHRAAPVQVSFHDGATSGLEEMDYWLSDGFLHPPDTAEQFTEDLRRLPVFYQYSPIEGTPPVGPPPTDEAGFITFASFNNPAKVNADVIGLWAKVLKSVPGSKVLLKYKNWYDQESLRGRVREGFAACGIEAGRIRFEGESPTLTDLLARYGDVDIALDPFPFNGATTTFQALWMGVPVVSLAGDTFISRAAGSMLHHAGLGDLAAGTPEDYVARAQGLATDLERLRTLRAGLRDRMAASKLCDAPTYALSVEAAYREMWQKWCAANTGTNR
ncbi:MAG: tetratricopeptide repeat protein [Rhodospirillales bacterium]|nr:tetratricopeptide repeat protein [Rhodospirillales bacterium]